MAANKVTTVAAVGVGTIGASWATFYAVKGLNVRLYDAKPGVAEAARQRARENLARLRDLGLVRAAAARRALARLTPVDTLEAALAGVEFVHESAVEQYEIKKPLFAALDRLTGPNVIIASSSSGLLISELQSVMKRPGRALIAHPFNPPHLIPLVELVSGKKTAPATIRFAQEFFTALGKVPVVLKKEVPGHIANRLCAALWREAIDLVASGVATVEDVDKALYAGPGLRWAFMGSHLIYHLGGGPGGYAYFIEHIGKAFEAYWKDMATWTAIPEPAKREVIKGVSGVGGQRSVAEIAEWRDERLAALLKVLYPTPAPRRRLKRG